MNLHVALTTVLHTIRHHKPEAQIAAETGIAPCQLRKFRNGDREPSVSAWTAILRAVHEVAPDQAQILAQAGLPGELYAAVPMEGDPHPLGREIMEAGAAVGRLQADHLSAIEDGVLDAEELDREERNYLALSREVMEGLAAIERLREKHQQKRAG